MFAILHAVAAILTLVVAVQSGPLSTELPDIEPELDTGLEASLEKRGGSPGSFPGSILSAEPPTCAYNLYYEPAAGNLTRVVIIPANHCYRIPGPRLKITWIRASTTNPAPYHVKVFTGQDCKGGSWDITTIISPVNIANYYSIMVYRLQEPPVPWPRLGVNPVKVLYV